MIIKNAGLYEECNQCDDWNGNMSHCCDVCYLPIRALEEFKKLREDKENKDLVEEQHEKKMP